MVLPQERAGAPVAREGWPFILAPLCLAFLLTLGGLLWLGLVFFLLACFATYFFRDPARVHSSAEDDGSDLVVCPADGKIVHHGPVPAAPLTGLEAVKISIFMNVFDVHVNRAPVAGKVSALRYVPGKFVNASLDKASEHNERLHLALSGPEDRVVEVVQIAGLIARRIVPYVKVGDVLEPGQRFGMIRFGSRVDLYLPPQTEIRVRVGQRVRAGETIIGSIK